MVCPQVYQRGRGWTIGAWFIPFANLYLPWRVTADIWNASGPPTGTVCRSPSAPAWSTPGGPPGWSACSWAASRCRQPRPRPSSSPPWPPFLAILVVRGLTAMQERHAEPRALPLPRSSGCRPNTPDPARRAPPPRRRTRPLSAPAS
ncbi:DUF4328 domain-containing protein [Kitasatospora fiedleri]|uniref:DUF4328 domain-containing protein n=1 Tax=Kitasatospora fiedleri TaxID=2991545 RepID=UPI00384CEB9A